MTGQNQIDLIKAAVLVGVRRFVPAEFEGLPVRRSASDDRNRVEARHLLEYYRGRIQSTTFVCGILYERFQPGGLMRSAIGLNSSLNPGANGEGDYIVNCRTLLSQAPAFDANNEMNVTFCLTAAHDVARFVTRALDMQVWPPEMRMHGLRIRVKDFVDMVYQIRGGEACVPFRAASRREANLLPSLLAC